MKRKITFLKRKYHVKFLLNHISRGFSISRSRQKQQLFQLIRLIAPINNRNDHSKAVISIVYWCRFISLIHTINCMGKYQYAFLSPFIVLNTVLQIIRKSK
jgi:hypothetical protein